jgi:hypothetical protein
MKNIFVLLLLLIFGILYVGFILLKHRGILKNEKDESFKKLIPAPVKK